MISSLDAVRAISRERGDAVVVSTMTPNRYWESVSENRDLRKSSFSTATAVCS